MIVTKCNIPITMRRISNSPDFAISTFFPNAIFETLFCRELFRVKKAHYKHLLERFSTVKDLPGPQLGERCASGVGEKQTLPGELTV